MPPAGRHTALEWTKRRWRCRNPGSARRTFTESVPQIPPRHRITARARAAIGAAVADGARTVIQAARDFEVSWPVAQAAFATRAAAVLPTGTPPVEHLGIDEIRRGKRASAASRQTAPTPGRSPRTVGTSASPTCPAEPDCSGRSKDAPRRPFQPGSRRKAPSGGRE
ncbi:helix-turn-helix domain-containing protein [Streptantibioticus cattleyicolor]|uniref:helix-turn-helix domain-containing protein n=1 Tax=Streptantibioticus cattleyicolor TaxID=29303 RepID=UPI001E39526A|nr:helix-turn-helix domain-containing protein [Streptantibioticus cattleyicolor]